MIHPLHIWFVITANVSFAVDAVLSVRGSGYRRHRPNERGFKSYIGTAFNMDLADTSCVSCGQCIAVCPTGALYEKDNTDEIFAAIADPDKYVVVQTAPSVRAGLGEEFGYPMGTDVEGKMVAALRRLGFDKVFDTDFAADLTIMEEAHEFLDRVQNGGKLPLITSCSPGWIKYCEHYFPDMTENLSSCKSPQQMFGAVMKTYFAKSIGVDPENICTVSVMPCTAKKGECNMELFYEEYAGHDVDLVLTTRELTRMIRSAHIAPSTLKDEVCDELMQDGSGAGVIFGATGGVMEAALRSVYEIYTGESLKNVNFEQVRGLSGVRRATINLNGFELKIGIAHGLGNARHLLEDIRNGHNEYHVIEIMACPGGCIGGGGQPLHHGNSEVLYARANALYREDANKPLRKSHENPYIKTLYEEYLGKPLGEKSETLLHTHYFNKSID